MIVPFRAWGRLDAGTAQNLETSRRISPRWHNAASVELHETSRIPFGSVGSSVVQARMTIIRLATAAFLGAMIMFCWSAFSHMLLLKGVGFTPLPDEERVTGQLKISVGDEGLYFFPGRDFQRSTRVDSEPRFPRERKAIRDKKERFF